MSSSNKIISKTGETMLSARKAAARLGCAPDYISKLCRDGKLMGEQLDGQWFVAPSSLVQFEATRVLAKEQRAEELAQQRRSENFEYKKQHGTIAQRAWLRARSISIGAPIGLLAGSALLFSALVFASSIAPAHTEKNNHALGAAVSSSESAFFGQQAPEVTLPSVSSQAFAGASNFLSGIFATLFGKNSTQVATNTRSSSTDVGAPQSDGSRTEQIPSKESAYPESVAGAGRVPTTVIQNTYPVIERTVVQQVASAGGVSGDELNLRLEDLYNRLAVQISNLQNPGHESPLQNFVVSQVINNLSDVRLNGDTVADNINGQYVLVKRFDVTGDSNFGGNTGISGNLAIGGSLNAATTTLSTLTVNGDVTTTGNATTTGIAYFNNDVNVAGNTIISGNLTVQNNNGTPGTAFAGTTTVSNLIVSNTSTSTFAGPIATNMALNVGGIAFFNEGVTASSTLNVLGDTTLSNATTTNFFATTASSTNLFALFASTTNLFAQNGTIGSLNVGSTTLSSLTVQGNGTTTGNAYFGGGLGVGIATSAPGVFQTASNAYIGGNLFVAGNSTTLGNSSSNTLTINSSINSSIVPNQNIQYDLGSPSFFWRNGYIGTLTANNIVANNTQIGGTQSSTFTINSDNVSSDAEDSDLIFFRGNVVPNALLSWKSLAKRFEFNQPLFIQNLSGSTTQPTFTLKGVGGQTGDILQIASSSGSTLFAINSQGAVSIGTTSILALTSGTTTLTNLSVTNTTDSTFAGGLIVSGNATTSGLSTFFSGILATASSTIGNGNQNGGLTISGGATTTGNQYIAGTLGVGIKSPGQAIEGIGSLSSRSSTGVSAPYLALNGTATGAYFESTAYGAGAGQDFIWRYNGTTELARLKTNGNFGIGTTTPSQTLSVQGNGLFSGNISVAGITATSTLNVTGLSTLGFASTTQISSTGSAYFATTGGSVGIGTAAPTQKLEVGGAGAIYTRFSSTNSDAALIFAGTNNTNNFIVGNQTNGASGGSNFSVYSVGTANDVLTILRLNGNLGVGSTTPFAKLSVKGAGTGTGINFQTTNSSNSPLFSILDNGNVGIGTTSPQALLGLQGSIGVNSTQLYLGANGTVGVGSTGNNARLQINGNGANTSYGQLALSNTAFSSNVAVMGIESAANSIANGGILGDLSIVSGSGINLGAQGGGTVKILNGSTAQVQLSGWSQLDSDSRDGAMFIGNTPAFRGVIQYGVGGANPILSIDNTYDSAGAAIQFRTRTSGTSTTTAMTIMGNGNVGIGTTSPANKLAVQGTARIGGASASVDFADSGASELMRFTGAGPHSIYTSGASSQLKIDASTIVLNTSLGGNVGIGTTSPSQALSVQGNGLFSGNISAAAITATSTLNVSGLTTLGNASTTQLSVSGTSYFGDTVAVTKTTPTAPLLQLTGSTFDQSRGLLDIQAPNSNSYNAAISVNNIDNGPMILLEMLAGGSTPFKFTYDSSTMYYQSSVKQQWTDAGGSPFMTLQSGNLGIGDTGPNTRLSVAGNAQIGFTAGTFGPANGLIVAGNVGIGTTTPWAKLSIDTGSNLAANAGEFAVGSSTRPDFVVKNNSNGSVGVVGVNTASPTAQLEIVGFGTSGDFRISRAPATNYLSITAVSGNDNASHFGINGTNVMALNINAGMTLGTYSQTNNVNPPAGGLVVSGNVGIGTSTPNTALDVNNSVSTVAAIFKGSNAGAVGIGSLNGAGFLQGYNNDSATANANLILEPNSGNVGIGTSTVVNTLSVSSGAGNNVYLGIDGTVNSGLKILNNTVEKWRIDNMTTDNHLRILAGASVEALDILQNGNVGIGNTAPGHRLSVGVDTASATLAGIAIKQTGTADGFLTQSSSNDDFAYLRHDGTQSILGSDFQSTGAYTPLTFYTSGAEKMRINTNGNVGIGSTTPTTNFSVQGNQYTSGTAFFGGAITATSTLNVTGIATLAGTVRADGGIGIGLAPISTDLTVYTNSVNNSFGARLYNQNSGSNASVLLGFNNGGTNSTFNLYGTGVATSSYIKPNGFAITSNGFPGIDIAALDPGGSINFWTGGTNQRMTIAANGNVGIGATTPASANGFSRSLVIQGAASASTLFTDGTNNFELGIDSAHRLRIIGSAAGSAFTIDTTGNVGIGGTTTPLAKLGVKGAGTGTGINFQTTDSNSNPLFSILDNGNVGIGSTTPGAQLAVSNSANSLNTYFRNSSNSSFVTRIENGGGSGKGLQIVTGSGTNSVATILEADNNAGTNFFTVTNGNSYFQNGNVGIGTTTPTSALSVSGNNGIFGTMAYFTTGSSASGIGIGGNGAIGNIQGQTAAGGIAANLSINANGGNVGIGTVSPNAKLAVTGASAAYNGSGIEGIAQLTTGTGANTDNKLQFGIVDSSYVWLQGVKPGVQTLNLALNPGGGNVGIGTTSPNYLLTVGDLGKTGRVQIDGNTAASTLGFGNGQYAGTTPVYNSTIVTTAAGTAAGNSMVFNIASGVSTVQNNVLTLVGNGNVGVGMSPGLPLDVNGTGRFVSPNSGSTGGVIIRDAVGNPNGNYLQFVNNANSAQYGYIQGLAAGGLSLGGGSVLVGGTAAVTVPGVASIQALGASAGIWSVGDSGGQGSIGVYDKTTGHVGGYLGSSLGSLQINTIDNAGAYTGTPVNITSTSVGIGTANPLSKLDIGAVDGTNEGGEIHLDGAGSSNRDWGVDVYQGHLRVFSTNNKSYSSFSQALDIDSSTNYLGIGTITPQSALDVNGTIRANNGGSTSDYLRLYNDTAAHLAAENTSLNALYLSGGTINFRPTANGTTYLSMTSATTTFSGSGGVNITSGCFAINGSCIGYTVKLAAIYATSTPGADVSMNFTGASGAAPSFSGGVLTLPRNTSYITTEVWGAGGGGAGGGSGGSGGTGGTTCFGTNTTACTSSTISAAGGTGATNTTWQGGAGGAGSGGDINLTGGGGGGGTADNGSAVIYVSGGVGGSAPRGGGGGLSNGYTGNGVVGSPFGGGGSGGGINAVSGVFNGGGGGGGGYAQKIINTPSGTYYYTVGAGGAGGTAGATTGGAGGAGGMVITVYATSSPNAAGNDYAELFPVSNPGITAGDIVAVDVGTPVSMKYAVAGDTAPLAGVISTAPGQTLGDATAQGMRPVALSGRVPVKVNFENGDIHTGDRIALSSVAGVGRKAKMFESSVGIALENHIQGVDAGETVTIYLDLEQGLNINDLGQALNSQFDIITATTTAAQLAIQVSTSTDATSTAQTTTATSTPPSNPGSTITTSFSSVLLASVGALGDMVVKVFHGAISASVGIFNTLIAHKIQTDELCVGDTCVTQDQFLKMVNVSNATSTSSGQATTTPDGTGGDSSGSATSTPEGTATSTPDGSDTVAPAITLIGADPAQLNVGDSYIDPGATVADTGSPNIGYTVSLDGATSTPPDQLHVDTSTAGTHIVLFSATDGAGNTGTATRTVIISDPNAGSQASSTEQQ